MPTYPKLPAGITRAEIIRYAKLDAGIKKLQPEHKRLNEKIKAAFNTVGSWVVSNVVIKRSTANGWDEKAATTKYPYKEHPEYYVVTPKIDRTKMPKEAANEFNTLTERLSVQVLDEIPGNEE
jgi:hypothetical protein